MQSLKVPLSESASLSVQAFSDIQCIYENQFDITGQKRSFEALLRSYVPFTSLLILPMEVQNHCIGNILFLSGNEPFDFFGQEISKLQGYVNQITSAVNNARLFNRAEAAARMKSEFLARMSHEIRSPLNAVLGMGELLTESPLNRDQKVHVDILMNSGGLLLAVVNDILDYSKTETGQIHVESIPFDLYRLMNELSDIISVSSERKGLSVDLKVSPDISRTVCGDPLKLSQVLINLADNAVRFTETGGVTIRLSKSRNPDLRDTVEFCVKDTGIGIPEDKLSGIFDTFSQAETSTTRRYGGTGLGLSITKKLVHLMGGTISVTSEVGIGSHFLFTVNLPETPGADHTDFSLASASFPSLKSSYDQGTIIQDWPDDVGELSVLLAEDLHTNIRVVEEYLKNYPVILDIACNGNEAVDMFISRRYDLVLMDIHMPEMDGYEALEKIRDWEEGMGLRKTPVASLSAHVTNEKGTHKDYDFDACIMKPFNRATLVSTLLSLVQTSPETAEKQNPHVVSIVKAVNTQIDPDLLEIIPELICEIQEEMETIAQSLKHRDIDTVIRLSHGFKGAAGNCGLTDLSEHFKSLCDVARNHDYLKAFHRLKEIQSYIGSLT